MYTDLQDHMHYEAKSFKKKKKDGKGELSRLDVQETGVLMKQNNNKKHKMSCIRHRTGPPFKPKQIHCWFMKKPAVTDDTSKNMP